MADPAAGSGSEAAWQAAVAAAAQGLDPDRLAGRTTDGIVVPVLARPADAAAAGPWRDTAPPFGIVQRVDHPDDAAANALALADCAGGATGLTLVGAGVPSARGFGVAADGPWPAVLAGVELGRTALRLELAPAAREAAVEALLALAGTLGTALDLDIGIDPVAETGGSVLQLAQAARARGLRGPVLRADGRRHHEAGASQAQELAAVLSSGVAALRALEPLGLDTARGALSFVLAAEADQLLTVAKFRALRRLWARVEDACGLPVRPLRLHAETSWRMLARQDPHTNILRTTLAAAAAILGGADSLTVLPFTSALGLPDAFARRLARNTPLVLLEEAHLGRVADPAAGAGSFEALTAALAGEAWRLFQWLEAAGGLGAALRSGSWQEAVAAMRDARRAAIASGQAILVGVTRFADPGASLPPVLMPHRDAAIADADGLPAWREAADAETRAAAVETIA